MLSIILVMMKRERGDERLRLLQPRATCRIVERLNTIDRPRHLQNDPQA